MGNLLQIRASSSPTGTTEWRFVNDQFKDDHDLCIVHGQGLSISEGDIWTADLIDTKKPTRRGGTLKRGLATLRLVTRVQQRQPWEDVDALPDFWIPEQTLKAILTWLHAGQPVALIGPKGTGKSSMGYAIAKALGWQDPCKVDVYMAKKTSDLFGSDAAQEGSTLFRQSALLDFIERAWLAQHNDTGDHFLLILDELNRVHAKSNESLHGLFDDIGQLSFMTTQGPKLVKLPPNIAVLATMNMGYTGTFDLDEAMKDRFMPVRVSRMPTDQEVVMLIKATDILDDQAQRIVDLANKLRELSDRGECSFAPSFRGCRAAAQLVRRGFSFRDAILHSMTGWLSGELTRDGGTFKAIDPSSEVAKVVAALSQATPTTKTP